MLRSITHCYGHHRQFMVSNPVGLNPSAVGVVIPHAPATTFLFRPNTVVTRIERNQFAPEADAAKGSDPTRRESCGSARSTKRWHSIPTRSSTPAKSKTCAGLDWAAGVLRSAAAAG